MKTLDKTDIKILKELKRDSRQPVKSLAKNTGIRPSTVHLRIQKLVSSGVIERFTIATSDEKTGEAFTVFILVNSEKEIPNSVFSNPCIKEVFGVTGEYDLMLKCKFSSLETFNSFILGFRKLEQVKKTVTMVATTKIKEI